MELEELQNEDDRIRKVQGNLENISRIGIYGGGATLLGGLSIMVYNLSNGDNETLQAGYYTVLAGLASGYSGYIIPITAGIIGYYYKKKLDRLHSKQE